MSSAASESNIDGDNGSLEPAIEEIVEGVEAAALGEWRPVKSDSPHPTAQRLTRGVNQLIDQAHTIVRNSERLAKQDSLTGLPNRAFLRHRLDSLVHDELPEDHVALLYLDLDGFKAVNDSLGHAQGDRLLELFSTRTRALLDVLFEKLVHSGLVVDQKDRALLFARIGGDEFGILVNAPEARRHSEWLATRLLKIMREPFWIEGFAFRIGVSLGIVHDQIDSSTEILRKADAAMYHAKASGRNQFCYFDQSIEERAVMRFELSTQLRRALEEHQFTLVYQPQCQIRPAEGGGRVEDVGTHPIISCEALLRWRHPERGTLAPGAFIEVAEEMGLISEIGSWVITEAAQTIAKIQDEGHECRVCINLSPSDLRNADLVDHIQRSLITTGARPDLLELEITESVAMSDELVILERINTLRRMGITFAIDDFGTGYSNLARLSELPIDRLKIDQSLVRDLTARADHRTIVQSIINLAHGLKLDVIAEGVETPEQATLLDVLGCDMLQGYLIGMPMWEDDFISILRAVPQHIETIQKKTA